MQSRVPLTRGTPSAYAPVAPRVAVRSLRSFGLKMKRKHKAYGLGLLLLTIFIVIAPTLHATYVDRRFCKQMDSTFGPTGWAILQTGADFERGNTYICIEPST
jgi:hypothetical protein